MSFGFMSQDKNSCSNPTSLGKRQALALLLAIGAGAVKGPRFLTRGLHLPAGEDMTLTWQQAVPNTFQISVLNEDVLAQVSPQNERSGAVGGGKKGDLGSGHPP